MKKLRTLKEHRTALAEVQKLMILDPKPTTRQGQRLVRLAAIVETFEKQRWPIKFVSDKERGVYRKFKVTRTDGSHKKGGKHENCAYFVLDLGHDEYAIPALEAYAKACKTKFPELAKDIERIAATRPCSCRAVGECMHFGPQTPAEALSHTLNLSDEP